MISPHCFEIKKCAAAAAHEKRTASNRRDASHHSPRNAKRRMHFYRSKIRTLRAIYVLTCVALISYIKHQRFARNIQLIEHRILLVTRLLISYTQTLFATRRMLLVTRNPLLVTRKLLIATRLNRGNFKEIHILNLLFSANIPHLYKICMFPHSFGYKKFPSNSIKVRREMWCRGRDSNPYSIATGGF